MSVLVAGYARTPFVRFAGAVATESAVDLGAHAVGAALRHAGILPSDVRHVIAGQVLQAGVGQNPARQTSVAAGIPLSAPAATVNVVCLSGSEAIAAAAALIARGDADIVVAVGQESMSSSPHAWVGSRLGKRYGAVEMLDLLEHDGLTDAFEHISMGAATERDNARLDISRADQDAVAARSHASASLSRDWLAGEIAPYETTRRGIAITIRHDDGVRPDTTVETLALLRPAFSADGTITAGNASQITDGAAAVVLVDEHVARARGLTPLAEVVAHALVAGPDSTVLHSQPSRATLNALRRVGLDTSALQSVEINEAFAAVVVQSTRDLGIDPAIINRHGGAIALGHPIGASGVRLVGTLARDLAELGRGSVGAAALCGGGGQGSALILKAV